jgi:hypothetical protein
VDHDRAPSIDQHDELDEVAGAVWADDEPPVRVLIEVLERERMRDTVVDVGVADAMTACRPMDLDTPTAYYENGRSESLRAAA